VFYFQPGHETFPIYHQAEVQQVITNAVRWCAPVKVVGFRDLRQAPHHPQPIEEVVIEE
jgi:trehalose utilization protein